MLRKSLLRLIFGGTLALSCIWGIKFQHEQRKHLYIVEKKYFSLQKKINALKGNKAFINLYKNQINFLSKKGWLYPKHRLIAGESLPKFNPSLITIRYKFEPEKTTKVDEKHTFKITKINIDMNALLDCHIYNFIRDLTEKFTGILRVKELIIEREDKINKNSFIALQPSNDSHFVRGKLIVEWVAMGEQDDKE